MNDAVRTVVFIDYENVGKLHALTLLNYTHVLFFRGAKQKAIDDSTIDAIAAMPPGRFSRVTLSGEGKNALDFHIAFYLAEELTRRPSAQCIVVSKDKGFDPLITHLRERGFKVSRCASLQAALRVDEAVNQPNSVAQRSNGAASQGKAAKHPPTPEDVVAFLKAHPSANRPRKRAGLVRVVETHYKGRIRSGQAQALVQHVLDSGAVSENEGKLTFNC
jgi:hypothetical protein